MRSPPAPAPVREPGACARRQAAQPRAPLPWASPLCTPARAAHTGVRMSSCPAHALHPCGTASARTARDAAARLRMAGARRKARGRACEAAAGAGPASGAGAPSGAAATLTARDASSPHSKVTAAPLAGTCMRGVGRQAVSRSGALNGRTLCPFTVGRTSRTDRTAAADGLRVHDWVTDTGRVGGGAARLQQAVAASLPLHVAPASHLHALAPARTPARRQRGASKTVSAARQRAARAHLELGRAGGQADLQAPHIALAPGHRRRGAQVPGAQGRVCADNLVRLPKRHLQGGPTHAHHLRCSADASAPKSGSYPTPGCEADCCIACIADQGTAARRSAAGPRRPWPCSCDTAEVACTALAVTNSAPC